MFDVTIRPGPNFTYIVDFDFDMIAKSFKDWFTVVVTDSEYRRRKDQDTGKVTGKREYTKVPVPHYLPSPVDGTLELGDTEVAVLRGHLGWVDWWLTKGPGSSMALNYDRDQYCSSGTPYLEYPVGDYRRLVLNNKWLQMYTTHPRGPYYVESQLTTFGLAARHPNAAFNLGTGLGKTEVILGITEHLAYQSEGVRSPIDDGNVVILVPGIVVKDEIIGRGEKYGTPITEKNWSADNRVNCVNPVGFMNSGAASDPDAIVWLSKVTAVISDEAHKLSSESAQKFIRFFLPSLQRSIAVSGSLDKEDGQWLAPDKLAPNRMSPNNALVVGLSGPCLIERKVDVPTRLTVINAEITPKEEYESLKEMEELTAREVHWYKKLELLMLSERLPDLVKYVYNKVLVVPDGEEPRLYIPFASRDSGYEMTERIQSRGFRTCCWVGGDVQLNGESVGSGVDDAKRLSNESAYDILLTSKVAYEGADLRGLNSVMPMLGSSWSQIAQPIGRSARGEEMHIILVMDTNNDFVMRQAKRRRDKILAEYQITKYETVNYDYEKGGGK